MSTQSVESPSVLPTWLHFTPATIYSISAVSILYGIHWISGPILGGDDLSPKLLCLGTLTTYELMLLGCALFLVIARAFKSDAVTLILLTAIFLSANAIVLEGIAGDRWTELTFAGISLVIAMLHLHCYKRFFMLPLDRLQICGFILMLVTMIMLAPVLNLLQPFDDPEAATGYRVLWQAALFLVSISITIFLSERYSCEVTTVKVDDSALPLASTPFLETSAMTWLVTFIVLTGTLIHFNAVRWVLDFPWFGGDFILPAGLAFLLILDLLLCYFKNHPISKFIALISLIPAIVAIVFASTHRFDPQLLDWNNFYTHPTLQCLGLAVAYCGFALRRKCYFLLCPAIIFLGAALALSGYSSTLAHQIPWRWLMTIGAVASLALSIYFRIPNLILAGGAFVIFMLTEFGCVRLEILALNLSPEALFAMLTGALILILHLNYPTYFHRVILWTGALLLASGAASQSSGLAVAELCCVFFSLAAALVMIGKMREWRIGLTLALPIIVPIVQIKPQITGWHFIGASFVLLIIGFLINLRKPSAQQNQSETK